jgi:hypothetical protein
VIGKKQEARSTGCLLTPVLTSVFVIGKKRQEASAVFAIRVVPKNLWC